MAEEKTNEKKFIIPTLLLIILLSVFTFYNFKNPIIFNYKRAEFFNNSGICTSWTYSEWSECSNNEQTRTIKESYPSGCSNGNPVIKQSCKPLEEIYIPNAYITAYAWFDNTPPGSFDIAMPIIHEQADGTGTYEDPITVAVGHVIDNNIDIPDYSAGTIFYIPNFRAYFIVEDLCGDGDNPQDIPCHNLSEADQGATTWIDIWINGEDGTKLSTDACSEKLTGLHLIIQNPKPNYEVVPGSIFKNNECKKQYGDELIIKQ